MSTWEYVCLTQKDHYLINRLSDKTTYTKLIKEKALAAGFSFCGISKSDFLPEEAPRLEQWLKNSCHGQMSYMENYFDKRLDTRLLVEDSKSVISLLYNYFPGKQQAQNTPKVSKYAYGEDYHVVIKNKLSEFTDELQQQIGDFHFRIFVDSAPVLEKAWAKKAGLGWIGKNSNLINKQQGSFFFLAEIILDVELDYDHPIKDYCGTCTACIDACPTDAIAEPYVVDGSKCISYFTIELKDALIPTEYKGKFEDWIFGCDICQDVCPWNRFSKPHQETAFNPVPDLLSMTRSDWNQLSQEQFQKLFGKSAVKRTKFSGIKRNLEFIR